MKFTSPFSLVENHRISVLVNISSISVLVNISSICICTKQPLLAKYLGSVICKISTWPLTLQYVLVAKQIALT